MQEKSFNLPSPRQEDIKAKQKNAQIFSKLDFKSAFWQLELHPDSWFIIMFYANTKLYQYNHLTMRVKPAPGELTTALRPLFTHIPHAHLIYDNLIIAAPNIYEHNLSLKKL